VTRRGWIGVAALAAVIGLAVASTIALRRPDPHPNVLLIVVDTLRADRLGCYGYERETSPRLDALAREGTRFDAAYAPSSWTLPSVASLFTATPPASHGVVHWSRALPPDPPTLAQALHDGGYVTTAIMGNLNVTADSGFDRGFELFLETRADDGFDVPGSMPSYPAAAAVTDRAVTFLDALQDRRFFLYVHYMDPHAPYLLPDDATDPWADPAYDGFMVTRLSRARTVMGPRFVNINSYFWSKVQDGPRDRRRIGDLYDAKVHYLDREIGRLLDHLGALGLAENTVVAVTSDHGEGLSEHGVVEHGMQPYQHQVRVPLILRGAGIEAGVESQAPVELVDLPLALTGLGLGPDIAWAGEHAGGNGALLQTLGLPVADAAEGAEGSVAATVHLRETRQEVRGLIHGDHKLMLDVATGGIQVFDLSRDPRELVDLAGQDPAREQEMLELLDRRLGPVEEVGSEPVELDPETLERLRAMGYVP